MAGIGRLQNTPRRGKKRRSRCIYSPELLELHYDIFLGCVSKVEVLQFRADLPSFQGTFPQVSAGLLAVNQGKVTPKCRQRRRKCGAAILETRPNTMLKKNVKILCLAMPTANASLRLFSLGSSRFPGECPSRSAFGCQLAPVRGRGVRRAKRAPLNSPSFRE